MKNLVWCLLFFICNVSLAQSVEEQIQMLLRANSGAMTPKQVNRSDEQKAHAEAMRLSDDAKRTMDLADADRKKKRVDALARQAEETRRQNEANLRFNEEARRSAQEQTILLQQQLADNQRKENDDNERSLRSQQEENMASQLRDLRGSSDIKGLGSGSALGKMNSNCTYCGVPGPEPYRQNTQQSQQAIQASRDARNDRLRIESQARDAQRSRELNELVRIEQEQKQRRENEERTRAQQYAQQEYQHRRAETSRSNAFVILSMEYDGIVHYSNNTKYQLNYQFDYRYECIKNGETVTHTGRSSGYATASMRSQTSIPEIQWCIVEGGKIRNSSYLNVTWKDHGY